MTSFAALSVAGLLAASPLGPPPAGTGDVSVEAAQGVWHGETGRYDFTGGVVVRRGAVTIRARSASLDPATQEVQAAGDVLLTDATRALHADGVHAVLDGPFEATGVIAFVKDGPVELGDATTLAEARRRGRNRLTASGDRVDGDAEGHLKLVGAHLTLCDCGADRAPTWEIRARRADIVPDQRAILDWPVLYVTPRFLFIQRSVPVLVFPWLYLPLGERQTGLLFPEVGRDSTAGWHLGQPVFVTLGRSADTTITPEYFFGPSDPHRAAGAVKGPGARVELRWAPAAASEGQVELRWVHDEDREPGGAGGDRLSLVGGHRQGIGEDTRLRLHLSLASDRVLFRDFSTELLSRGAYYSKSDALASHRSDALVLEGSAAYLEPLQPADLPVAWPSTRSFGAFGGDMPALHRWPSGAATLLPLPLGPLLLQGRAGISRFAPLTGHRGELAPGDPGYAAALDADALAASGREAATRIEARLELSAPLLLGGALSVEPFLRGAAVGYAFDAGRDATAVAWGMGGLSASAELSRHYGELEHRIVPRAELLAGTAAARATGTAPTPAYDLWDRVRTGAVDGGALPVQRLSAAPDGAYAQLRLSVENRLDAGTAGALQLVLGQDLDVRAGRAAETFVSAAGHKGPFSGDATVRFLAFGDRPANPFADAYRSSLDELTEVHASLALRDARGDSLTSGLTAIGPGAVGAQASGADTLFDLRPATSTGTSGTVASSLGGAGTVSLGARGVLAGATMGYDVQLAARRTDLYCAGGTVRHRDAGGVTQQVASLTWNSPCHCFLGWIRVSMDACGEVSYTGQVDLSKILQGARGP